MKKFSIIILFVLLACIFCVMFFYIRSVEHETKKLADTLSSLVNDSKSIQKSIIGLGDQAAVSQASINSINGLISDINDSLDQLENQNRTQFHSVSSRMDRANDTVSQLVLLQKQQEDAIADLKLDKQSQTVNKSIDTQDSDREKALQDIEQNPNNFKALLTLGKIFFEEDDLFSASHYLEKAVEIEPFNVEAFQILGRIYKKENDNSKSAYAYNRLTKLEPDNSLNYYNLALCLLSSGQLVPAKTAVEKALKLDTASTLILNLAGRIFNEMDQKPEAISFLKKSLEINEDPIIYSFIGDLYMQVDQKEEALGSWKKAVELSDQHTEQGVRLILDQYGKLARYAYKNEQFRAVDSYFRSVKEIGGDEDIYYIYLQSLYRRKMNTQFTEELRNFEKKYPDSRYNSDLAALKSQPNGV